MTDGPVAGTVAPESLVIEVDVGADGKVLIPREIRERIGIGPGWIARQRIVGAHLEILFIPPEPARAHSAVVVPDEEWAEVKERAVAEGITADWEAREEPW